MPLNQFEIRTEEINEILGKTPNRIIRWGISVFFIVILLLLVSSYFFKYPDFITSTIEITTTIPPSEIKATSGGKIEKLFVDDMQLVSKGEYLALIENTANYDHVKKLISFVNSISDSNPIKNFDAIRSFLQSADMILGDLQPYLANFKYNFKEYENYLTLSYHVKRIVAIKKQIADRKNYKTLSEKQLKSLTLEFDLTQKELNRFKGLYEEKIVAESEYEKIEANYYKKKYSLEGFTARLAEIDSEIMRLQNDITDLELQNQIQQNQLENKLQKSFNELQNQIKSWELKYVLKSPIKGKCSFTKIWNVNQNVKTGKTVLTIVPSNDQQIIGKLLLPVQGSGKVKKGQKLNIKLFNYPFMEYGMLLGRIENISLVPEENYYSVEVALINGLTTNYKKELNFHQKMQGTAEIITEERRLIERVISPLKSLIKNKSY